MKKNTMMVNTLLAVVLGAGLLVGMVWRAFMPYVVLPKLDVIAVAGITLIALTIESNRNITAANTTAPTRNILIPA